MKTPLKTLSFAVALALSIPMNHIAVAATDPLYSSEEVILKAVNDMFGKPNAREGLIQTNQQIYYAGDPISIHISLPEGLKPLLGEAADLQILLHTSAGDLGKDALMMLPVAEEGRLFEGTIDTVALPPGAYQLALVLVKPNGNATKVTDWLGGFGALLSTTRIKISAQADTDNEDIDSDGFVEGDADGDGYVDLLMGDHEQCSNAVLKGTYSYVVNGLTKDGQNLKDYLEMGFDIFDGQGRMTSVSANGLDRATYQSSASYTVDQNCQGTVTYDNGGAFSMFVSLSGDDFYYLSTGDTPGESFGGRERRLTKMPDTGCTAATLNGVYSYAARGVKRGVLWIETGFRYFDGQGNVTNIFTSNVGKQAEYARGTYSVDTNCLGVATYPSAGTAERYALFASPTGNELSWLQIDGLQLLGIFGGVDTRSARSVEGFNSLATFTSSGTPVDPNIEETMLCNMPAPADVPAGVEVKCGEGYQVVADRCQLATETPASNTPLVNGPAALCPAGVMLKPR